jgi:hypothetical protein
MAATLQVSAIPGMTPLGIKPVAVKRHGGPWDRGSADSYYHRPSVPHYYVEGTGTSQRVGREGMTAEEIASYEAGYQWNEDFGDKKSWD